MNRRTATESKESILEAAIKVFSEKGYSQTTIREVAKRAGISVGGVYIYFKNKEEIYFTLLKYLLDEFRDRAGESIKDIEDPAEAVKNYIAINLNYAKKFKGLILIEGREHGFTSCIDIKKKFFKGQRKLLESIIKNGIDSGKFERCNIKGTAKVIIGTLRGFILSLVMDSDSLFSPEECSVLILNGILKRGKK
ncbi:MAG TPA: TetR/AcrR family transcriptional regulator [Nitrospinae bacterium]|nr:TetR/AcrR family transcriptional regulator [Nitrospinota bacterium]